MPEQVRLASVAENSFNAVERIDEIAHIDQEDRDDIPGSRPDGWPSSGKVCTNSLSVMVYCIILGWALSIWPPGIWVLWQRQALSASQYR